jgi:hypothetical protein
MIAMAFPRAAIKVRQTSSHGMREARANGDVTARPCCGARAANHLPDLRAFLRWIDPLRGLASSWLTCLASRAAYAATKGFGCGVIATCRNFFAFLAMTLLRITSTVAP